MTTMPIPAPATAGASAALAANRSRALAAIRPLGLGRVTEMVGLHLRVTGLRAAVGDLLEVQSTPPVLVEVAASSTEGLVCLPLGRLTGIQVGAYVRHTGGPLQIRVGDALRGRVLDGLGRPIDGGPHLGALPGMRLVDVDGDAPDALARPTITRQLGLGVRALDSLVPCGRGQRIGIMAGSGVGKSSLLSMIARGTDAEVSVIALVGERGREVREFIENDLGPEGLARSVLVVATSDAPPVERLRSAFVATRIAESFRDAGRDVVLMMDSLTRVAMAQREIGLSAGEPPATRGYPPSVFNLMPRLLERAGTSPHGSITGLYTVLVEGDDLQDPIGDTARSILDGHVVLARNIAETGRYPAIDIEASISRAMPQIVSPEQLQKAQLFKQLYARYQQSRDLISVGAYAAGSDPLTDKAMEKMPAMQAFLQQGLQVSVNLSDSQSGLEQTLSNE